jgi:hypothetical protein
MCEDVAGAVQYRDINPAGGTLPEKMGLELRSSPVIVDDQDLDIEWLKMAKLRSSCGRRQSRCLANSGSGSSRSYRSLDSIAALSIVVKTLGVKGDPGPAYFAFAALAGGLLMIFSLVGLSGVFTGMLSGLVALAAPEAAAGGGFTIGVCGCGVTAWACAVTTKAVEITSTKAVPGPVSACRGFIVFSRLFFSSPSRNVCPGRAVAEWPTAQRSKHEGYWSAGIAAFWKIIVRFSDKTAPFRTEGRLPRGTLIETIRPGYLNLGYRAAEVRVRSRPVHWKFHPGTFIPRVCALRMSG